MRIAYLKEQSVKENDSFSHSASKPEKIMALWKNYAVAEGIPLEIVSFLPSTREDLFLVHKPSYVNGILDLKEPNGFGNFSPEIAKSLPYVSGSMVAASLDSLENKICFSPTSGAHHAGYGSGMGFCTFNFLVLAALKVHQKNNAKIGIIDCDAHYGNGTDDIIKQQNLDFIKHYSFGRDSRTKDAEYISRILPEIVKDFSECRAILYNAGADAHIDDFLGGCLTTEQLKERDRIVLSFCKEQNIPVSISLAGGYQEPFSKVLNTHLNTFKLAHQIFK